MEEGSWVQLGFGALATAGLGIGGYLKSIVTSGDRKLEARIERMENEFARKDTLKTAIDTLQAGQDATRTDLRITNEKLDDVARDVNILIGKFDAQFNVQQGR